MAVSATTTGTGIDVNTVVSQLMVAERQPINALNQKVAANQTKISVLGALKSKIATLQTAAQALKSTGSFQQFATTPADSSILTASATGSAAIGDYSIKITSLAHAQQLVAAGQTSATSAIGSGGTTTLSFDFGTIDLGQTGTLTNGTYANASFTGNGSATKTVTIDSTNNTLEGIRDAINAANIGVSASIINDGGTSPYRLALSSSATGVSNSMQISVSGDSAISNLLAYDPQGTQNLSQTVAAENANFTINGVAITKSSNVVTDAIQGVTLNLSKTTTTPTSLTVSRDLNAVTNAASSFVSAYNDVYSNIKTLTGYDPVAKTGGTLQGDASINGLLRSLRGILGSEFTGGGTLTSLTQVGITSDATGTLSVDTTKFGEVLASDPTGVSNMFTSAGGFANQFYQWASSAQNVTINGRTDGLNKQNQGFSDQIARLETRMTSIEKNYRTQFTALNTLMSNFNQTSTFLTRQLG